MKFQVIVYRQKKILKYIRQDKRPKRVKATHNQINTKRDIIISDTKLYTTEPCKKYRMEFLYNRDISHRNRLDLAGARTHNYT